MHRRATCLVAALLGLPACGPILPNGGAAFPGPNLDLSFTDGPVGCGLKPVIVTSILSVGDRVRFDATFTGDAARTGYVVWTTLDPAVVRWDAPDPPCPNDRCRILVGVAPGATRVRIHHFAGPGSGCAYQDSAVAVRMLAVN